MRADATRNMVLGLISAGSAALGSGALGSGLSFLGLSALAALGVGGGGGGGVGGSSTILVRGFLGALSFAPVGRPCFFGSGNAGSLSGGFSAIVASFSGTCSVCSGFSAICNYNGKCGRRFYRIVTTIDQLGRLVNRL